MRIDLADRDGTNLRYFVYDDAGNELRQVHRDCAHEIETSAKQHRSIVDVLIEAESGEKQKKERRRQAIAPDKAAPVATNHTHEEFGWPAPEHEHLELAPVLHEHPHSHAEFPVLDTKIASLDGHVTEELKRLDTNLSQHGHFELSPLNHGHADLDTQIANQRVHLQALNDAIGHEHTHPDLAPASAIVALLQRISELEATVRDLQRAIATHEHDLPTHTHPGIEHGHPALQTALDEHIVNATRRTNAQVLSRQEINGKTRLVLEEVD